MTELYKIFKNRVGAVLDKMNAAYKAEDWFTFGRCMAEIDMLATEQMKHEGNIINRNNTDAGNN